MRDMEAMVDLLRFGVPQWRHERLQARPCLGVREGAGLM